MGSKAAQRMYWYRFTMRGTGPFPTDMLRRDRCFPYSSDDAAKVAAWDVEPFKQRRIELACWQDSPHWQPNFGRWASFGWRLATLVQE